MLEVSQLKVNITPCGQFFPQIMPNGHLAESVADEQYASIMVLKNHQQLLIWICLDAIGTSKQYTDNLRKEISMKYEIPIENINIGYTHSHCAVNISDGNGLIQGASKEFQIYVHNKIIDGIQECFNQGLEEVNVYESHAYADGFYSNRNGLEKIGDTEIKILYFKNIKDEIKGLILIYACHATVINFQKTRSLNSDLGGYLARKMEQITGIYPLIMLGAAGDMSNRCCRQGYDYDELIRVGDGLMQRIHNASNPIKLEVNELSIQPYKYHETFVTTRQMRNQQIENIKDKIQNAPTEDLKRVFNSALSFALKDPNGCTFDMDVQGTIIKLGDIQICTMPAELFSCLGLKIKQAMSVKCPIFWGYSNYSVGYLYNQEEAGLSFESAATNIPAGIPEKIVQMVCKMVK